MAELSRTIVVKHCSDHCLAGDIHVELTDAVYNALLAMDEEEQEIQVRCIEMAMHNAFALSARAVMAPTPEARMMSHQCIARGFRQADAMMMTGGILGMILGGLFSGEPDEGDDVSDAGNFTYPENPLDVEAVDIEVDPDHT